MLILIKKELTANVRYMLMGLLVFFLYAVFFRSSGDLLFGLCLVFFFYTVTTTNLTLDERYKIDLLTSSLPVSRREVILSKYLLTVVIFIIGFLIYTLMFLCARVLGSAFFPALTPFGAVFGFFALCLFNSIILPLAYRFSAQSMRYFNIIFLMVLFVLFNIIGSKSAGGIAGALIGGSGALLSVLLLAVSVAVSVFSFLITARIYSKKDF